MANALTSIRGEEEKERNEKGKKVWKSLAEGAELVFINSWLNWIIQPEWHSECCFSFTREPLRWTTKSAKIHYRLTSECLAWRLMCCHWFLLGALPNGFADCGMLPNRERESLSMFDQWPRLYRNEIKAFNWNTTMANQTMRSPLRCLYHNDRGTIGSRMPPKPRKMLSQTS